MYTHGYYTAYKYLNSTKITNGGNALVHLNGRFPEIIK